MGGNHSSSLVAVDDHLAGTATPYSPQDVKMMTEFLPDFVTPYHSTKKDQELLLAHWDKLFSQTVQGGSATAPSPMVMLFDNFYKHLFEIAPEVKPLFRSSMQVQGKALVRIVGSIKSMLLSPDIVSFAADLAKRHVAYGIKLPYFNALGIALMKTLRACSEEMWTPETEDAWRKVYVHVALIVVVELSNLDPSRRRSSLMQSLVSVREKSQRALSHREKSQRTVDHPHHGQHLDPNATCPMSGQKLSDMPQVAPPAGHRRSLSQQVLGLLGLGSSSRYQQ